jgi:hypothetical protein
MKNKVIIKINSRLFGGRTKRFARGEEPAVLVPVVHVVVQVEVPLVAVPVQVGEVAVAVAVNV